MGAHLAQEEVWVCVVLDEVLSTAGARTAVLQVGCEAGTAECVPTGGDKGIPQQRHTYGAAQVVDQVLEARSRPHRTRVSLLGLPIDLKSVWIVMLMIGGLLHLRPFVNHFCRPPTGAITVLPLPCIQFSALLHHRACPQRYPNGLSAALRSTRPFPRNSLCQTSLLLARSKYKTLARKSVREQLMQALSGTEAGHASSAS